MGKEKKALMGKNAKIIIFSLIGLAVLGGVAALLMLTAPEQKAPAENNDFKEPVTASDSADLTLCKRDEKDIVSVEITNDSGTYSITPSGNTDSEGSIIWTIADIASAPLNSSALSTAVGYAAEFDAKEFAETVADSSELAKYGLDKPVAQFRTTFTDGSTFELKVGSEVPNTASSVYVTPDGKGVYTAYKSRTSSYTGSKYSFVSLSVMPAYDQNGGEEVMKMTVERTDLDKPIAIENIIPESEDAIQVYSYRMTSPYTAYVDLTEGPKFAYSVFGLNAASVYSLEGDSNDLSALGFDAPLIKASVETNVKTYTLTIGSSIYETRTDDDGNERSVFAGCYAMSSEHPGIVYILAPESVNGFGVAPSALISKLFLMPYIYDLESIEYSDNTDRKLDIGIKLIEAPEANKEEVSEFTVNGEKWDDTAFKNLYQYLISCAGEELYLDSEKGGFIAEIVYNYTDKADGINGKDVVRLYESENDRKVIIELNGENLFKTRRLYATQLFANIENFLSGGEITLTY